MGIYFIAAGKSTRNREKSLDRSFSTNKLRGFLRTEDFAKLEENFPSGNKVYIWGANDGTTFNQLANVSSGEYVVDVKNKEVVQVFEFCFYINTGGNTQLQEYIGWDEERPREERRPYKYVFFLKNPRSPGSDQKEKKYFQSAFDMMANRQWLVGQRWFSGSQISQACRRINVARIEELIWGSDGNQPSLPESPSPNTTIEYEDPVGITTPPWLEPVLNQVRDLKRRSDHQERDHEDLVKELFKTLEYKPVEEIQFQRGRIDVLIAPNDDPLITIEVKKDWNVSRENSAYIRQAFNYSNESGTRFVIVTNGDRYLVFDKDVGRSYDDMFKGEFELTRLTENGLQLLLLLKRPQ